MKFILILLASFFANSQESMTAEQLISKVESRLGGSLAWQNTNIITWNFFGRRFHIWNKQTNDARIESENEIILYNLNSSKGKLYRDGIEITELDSVQKAISKAKKIWNNDSYWLFMPYKLRDKGVTVKKLADGEAFDKTACYRLQLTFENVGDTPDNKYIIYISKTEFLVIQWDYFAKYSDEIPRFSTPWSDWKPYGDIMLSAGRGKSAHTDIHVLKTIEPAIFYSETPIDLNQLIKGL
jgi:hypothetical protein